MRFQFATTDRIIFGEGTAREAPTLAAEFGRHALVVTGRSRERSAFLIDLLKERQVRVTPYIVVGEPTTDRIADGLRVAREAQCDQVIGIGGGSVIDAAKIISALMTNDGELMEYLEVIGEGRPLAHRAAPYIAMPTTAGTGAEVTRNAVVGSPEHRVKVSMRNELMLPRVALVDPELTYDLPQDITAASGLDALTQLMEVFVSDNSSPMTDAVCREGMSRARNLRTAWEGSNRAILQRSFKAGLEGRPPCRPVLDRDQDRTGRSPSLHEEDDEGASFRRARADMCLAALCSGLALANARLGAVHGLAGPLGGMYPAPHGAVCARLLPFVMEANLNALRERDPENRSVERYDEIARILTGRPDAVAQDGMDWVQALCDTLSVQGLGAYGVQAGDFHDIISKSRNSSSMKGNPVTLTDEEVIDVLQRAL